MAIFVHSPELTQEFRRSHRRGVVLRRAQRRRQRDERPREVRIPEIDTALDRAIEKPDIWEM